MEVQVATLDMLHNGRNDSPPFQREPEPEQLEKPEDAVQFGQSNALKYFYCKYRFEILMMFIASMVVYHSSQHWSGALVSAAVCHATQTKSSLCKTVPSSNHTVCFSPRMCCHSNDTSSEVCDIYHQK